MALIYPNDVSVLETNDTRHGEIKTLNLLRSSLPNGYSIYHSVHWSKSNAYVSTFGEIDFVIVNKSGEILVIEQKNGVLEETPDGLEKSYGLTKKLVQSQIQRSIGGIRKQYSKQHKGMPGLSIDYLIYCPDYKVINVNAAGVDMLRVVDRDEKVNLTNRIEKLLAPETEKAHGLAEELHNFLLSSFRISPDINAYKSSQERVYCRLLSGLSDVIDNLEIDPYKLRVIGTAGSGKTQVTMRFCDKMRSKGKNPLLLCFNRPLADKLREIAEEEVTVNTYYGFCRAMAELAGLTIDFSRADEDGFWRDIQERLIAADLKNSPKYSGLIVDEGQDFHNEWYEIIQLFLTEDATQLWLEDPLQNLRSVKSVILPGFVTYHDTSNFRTPTLIASLIKKVLERDFLQRNTLPGLGVESFTYGTIGELKKILAHRITELVRAGFKQEDIAIISCRGMNSSALREINRLGSYSVRRFTGDYDKQDNQIYTEGKLNFDTIFRFKGQQAPAVILVDLDETLEINEWARNVLYCAMTRATLRLELIVKDVCPWIDLIQENL